MGGGGTGGAGGFYDAALQKRQAMMGKSGPSALIKNWRVFRVALFACIGGVMYGYNQGMFSGVLAMPAFNKRRFLSGVWHEGVVADKGRRHGRIHLEPIPEGVADGYSGARCLDRDAAFGLPRRGLVEEVRRAGGLQRVHPWCGRAGYGGDCRAQLHSGWAIHYVGALFPGLMRRRGEADSITAVWASVASP